MRGGKRQEVEEGMLLVIGTQRKVSEFTASGVRLDSFVITTRSEVKRSQRAPPREIATEAQSVGDLESHCRCSNSKSWADIVRLRGGATARVCEEVRQRFSVEERNR